MANNIEVIPGFWGSMLQGFNQGNQMGQENYWRTQQMEAQQREREQQQRMQGFQMLSQLYQQGAVSPEQMSAGAQGMTDVLPFLKNTQFAANPAWLKNQMATGPEVNAPVAIPGMGTVPTTPRYTEQQYAIAGVESPTERTQRRKITETQTRMLGAQATSAEHAASPEMLNIDTYNQISKAFGSMADSTTGEIIAAVGGLQHINDKNINTLPDEAMKRVEASGMLNRFGQMSPEQKQQFRGMIADRLNNAYLQWYQAQSSRISALRQGQQTTSSWDRIADNLLNQAKLVSDRILTMQKDYSQILGPFSGPMIESLSKGKPEEKRRLLGVVNEYKQLQDRQATLSRLSAKATYQKSFTPEEEQFLFNGGVGTTTPEGGPPPSRDAQRAMLYMIPPAQRSTMLADPTTPEDAKQLLREIMVEESSKPKTPSFTDKVKSELGKNSWYKLPENR